MAFCTKCGKEFKEGDQFCFYCGTPIPVAKIPEPEKDFSDGMHGEKKESVPVPVVFGEREAVTSNVQGDNANKSSSQGNKKIIIPIICGGVFLFLVFWVFVFFIFGTVLKRDKAKTEDKEITDTKIDDTKYVNYLNSTVCFMVDYPDGYTVTEPDDNNVLITDGKNADFQVSIEYAYHTTSNTAIYSADDFADQIKEDPNVLKDWLGTRDAETTDAKACTIGGRDGFEYDVRLQMDTGLHTGKIYIIKGDGAFGCYSYLWMVNEDCENAQRYKTQCNAMTDTFKVTGACQAEGYTIYPYDEFDMQFMIRDEAMGKTENSGGSIVVYPVEHVFTEANIWIDETSYTPEEKDINGVLESKCNYYFNHYDQTKYLSQPTELDYGRYPYTGVDVEFYDKGEKYTLSVFAFVHNGKYWTIAMKSTDEYYDTCATAVSDILFSLKFGTESTWSSSKDEVTTQADTTEKASAAEKSSASGIKDMVTDILADIQKEQGFVANGSWKPLAVLDDFNGDQVQELLTVYERKKSDVEIDVMYSLWSLSESGPVQIKSDVLFLEVGGNSGVVGIVKSGGKAYLAIERYEPEAEQFNNYYSYIPWSTKSSSLEDADVYMESHGEFDKENQGRYILGATAVDLSDFNKRHDDFSDWLYKLDILSGAGNGDVMTFDDLLSYVKKQY